MRILTVEDSTTARMIVVRTLSEAGHEVAEAANGAAALELMRTRPFDVVLLDWNMPGMTGLECLEEIRAEPAWRDVRVVMCTTEAEKPQIVRAIQAGADSYLLKPIGPDTLVSRLTEALEAA